MRAAEQLVRCCKTEWETDVAERRRKLAQRRKAVGFSQEGFAERLGVDRSTVARWEAGKTEPLPWLRPKLSRVLQVSIGQLDQLLVSNGGAEGSDDDRLKHAAAHPMRVDLMVVAQLRELVHYFDVRYDKVPATSLLADAGKCLGQVSFLRAHAPTSRIERELCRVEAEAATLMGQLVWDASQRRDNVTARSYLGQAVSAARAVRDHAAEGLALLRTSFVALYGEKDPRGGLDLTLKAAEVTRGTSQVLTGQALLHTAEAHAMLGQRRDCEQALDQAGACFENIDAADAAIDLFSATQHGRVAGSCYLFLGDVRKSQMILEHAADDLRDRSKSQAIILGNLALAHIRQRNVEGAATALHNAIDVVETSWGGGGLNLIFKAAGELRGCRRRAPVQGVYDRLMDLLSAS